MGQPCDFQDPAGESRETIRWRMAFSNNPAIALGKSAEVALRTLQTERFVTEKRTTKTTTSYNWRPPSAEGGTGSLCPCDWLECDETTVEEHTRHEKELAPSYFSLGCLDDSCMDSGDHSPQVVLSATNAESGASDVRPYPVR